MADYALVSDVEDGWRPLTASEQTVAATLIHRASLRVDRQFPWTAARLVSGELDPDEVVDVVAGMVRRAMTASGDGVTQQNQTAGPFGTQVMYANPQGNLYFTKEDRATLGLRRGAFSVDLTPPAV